MATSGEHAVPRLLVQRSGSRALPLSSYGEDESVRAAAPPALMMARTFKYMELRKLDRKLKGVVEKRASHVGRLFWLFAVVVWWAGIFTVDLRPSDGAATAAAPALDLEDAAGGAPAHELQFTVSLGTSVLALSLATLLALHCVLRLADVVHWVLYWVYAVAFLALYAALRRTPDALREPAALTQALRREMRWALWLLLALEALTLACWLLVHRALPALVARASDAAIARAYNLRALPARDVGEEGEGGGAAFAYSPPWWRLKRLAALSVRRKVHYCYYAGQLRDERPHGYGEWRDDASNGECLRGYWNDGRPVAPFHSRQFKTGYAFASLHVATVTARAEGARAVAHAPRRHAYPALRASLAAVECSVSGEFFSSYPRVELLYQTGEEALARCGAAGARALNAEEMGRVLALARHADELLPTQSVTVTLAADGGRLFVSGFEPRTPADARRAAVRIAPIALADTPGGAAAGPPRLSLASAAALGRIVVGSRAQSPRPPRAEYQPLDSPPGAARRLGSRPLRMSHPQLMPPPPLETADGGEGGGGAADGAHAAALLGVGAEGAAAAAGAEDGGAASSAAPFVDALDEAEAAAAAVTSGAPVAPPPRPPPAAAAAPVSLEVDGWVPAGRGGARGLGRPELLLYVHGFNMSAVEGQERIAQLLALGRFPPHVKPLVFSWPTGAVLSYASAVRSARSEPVGADLCACLRAAADAGVRDVHLFAHSMGAQVVLHALPHMVDVGLLAARGAPADAAPEAAAGGAAGGGGGGALRLATLTLVNPEVDEGYFLTRCVPLLRRVCAHVSLYGDNNDGALFWSEVLNRERSLGKLRGAPYRAPPSAAADASGGAAAAAGQWVDMDVIDMTWLEHNVHSIRHNSFNLNRMMVDDLREVIVDRKRAAQRSSRLVRRAGHVFSFLQPPSHIVND